MDGFNNKEFKIFQSLIEGVLDPFTSISGLNPTLTIKIPNEIKDPISVEAFEFGLKSFLEYFPGVLENKDFSTNYENSRKTTGKKGFVFKPKIEIELPPFFNANTELYYFLTLNASVWWFYSIDCQLNIIRNKDEKNLFLGHELYKIESLLRIGLQKREERENRFAAFHSSFFPNEYGTQLKKFNYLIDVLALNLVRLHFEIIDSFAPLADRKKKSVYELLRYGNISIDAARLIRQIDFGIARMDAQKLSEEKKFKKEKAIECLNRLYGQKDFEINQEIWKKAVSALENRLLFQDWEGKLGMEYFSSFNFAEVNLFEIQEKYQEEIENLGNPKEKIKKVEGLILNLKLTFEGLLPEDVELKNSIPQRLLAWLNEQKELYRNQDDKNFTGFENYDNSGKKNQPKTKDDEKISFECFTYVQLKDNPDKLDNIFLKLIEYYPEIGHRFISENTDKRNFRKIFSGSKDKIENPIFWVGFENELKYFIDLIHNDYKLVSDLKQKQYEVMAKCFVNKEGRKYDWRKFHSKNPPVKSAEIMERLVSKQLL